MFGVRDGPISLIGRHNSVKFEKYVLCLFIFTHVFDKFQKNELHQLKLAWTS